LLKFIFGFNQNLLTVKTTDPKTYEELTILLVALHTKDAVLLEILLSLRSEVLLNQFGEMGGDGASLTRRFIRTDNVDIWVALSCNTPSTDYNTEGLLF